MVAGVLAYLSYWFLGWLSLFTIPFVNENLLWIVIPVYLNWILAEFYSEKLGGVSYAGAITKGIVLIWVGIDWARKTTGFLNTDVLGVTLFKYILCLVWVAFGIFLITQGVYKNKIVKFIGKSRNTTYLTLVFTPVLYNVIPVSLDVIFVIILFFPIYYLVIEIIDRIVPDPKIGRETPEESIPSRKERKVLEKQMGGQAEDLVEI
jgi:hypothetical protein